jgi:hypothetical protein
MTYTLCIHNLIYYYSQERVLAGVGGIRSNLSFAVIRSVSVICLQLSCLFSKRELGNRYGPF